MDGIPAPPAPEPTTITTVIPNAELSPTATAEAQKPIPEIVQECFIHDAEACKTARMVKIGGREFVALQVKPGIPFVTRLNGEKTVTKAESPFQGVRIGVVNRTTTEVEDFRGAIDAEIKPLWISVDSGSVVGITQEGEIYVRFTKVDSSAGGIVMDKERTEKAFPGILQKPVEELSSEPVQPSISYIYQ